MTQAQEKQQHANSVSNSTEQDQSAQQASAAYQQFLALARQQRKSAKQKGGNSQKTNQQGAKPNQVSPKSKSDSANTESNSDSSADDKDTVKDVLDGITTIAVVSAQTIHYLLTPPGNCWLFLIAAIYCLGVGIEGWYQSLPGNEAIAFMPKPGIGDSANLFNLFSISYDPNFWIVAFLNLCVQGLQSWVLMDVSPGRAKRKYEQVAHYKVPSTHGEQITLAKVRAKQFKGAGMKKVRKLVALAALGYLIDIAFGHSNYPFLQSSGSSFLLLFGWFCVSVIGSDFLLSAAILSGRRLWDDLQDKRRQRKTKAA